MKIKVNTVCKSLLSDLLTPVSIYLRLRDRFRDTILLESSDRHTAEDSYSFICVNAIAGIEINSAGFVELKYPANKPQRKPLSDPGSLPQLSWSFMQNFEIEKSHHRHAGFAQGLYGYTTYDASAFFEKAPGLSISDDPDSIPLMRYRLYQYVIVVNHFNDELTLCENCMDGIQSETEILEALIKSKDVPVYPFRKSSSESSSLTDDQYRQMVADGIASCKRGDVFQIVLSRQFKQSFKGDEFNVYRSLRSINPSPYLFFFDYGDYKLMGSSPEAQLVIREGNAILHPIAGTCKRTGDAEKDDVAAKRLMADAKENAEHVMLVDLARNDLSRICEEVHVVHYRQVQYFSHVIHLVSEVAGKLSKGSNPFEVFAKTFPAGTLSGAPKVRAMQLIQNSEPQRRGFYGGAIGFVGFNGDFNHAIMIRTISSRNNTLFYQAGAGVVAASKPEQELQEVNNKLRALTSAFLIAEQIN
jgi:anthranilate synthase component 1